MNISFTTVMVKDLDASVKYYEKVFGFKIDRSFQSGPDMKITFLKDDKGNKIEFIEDKKSKPFSGEGISFGFYVDDIEDTKKNLISHNVAGITGPFTLPNGVKLMHAKDLNGVGLIFVQE